MVVFAGDYLHHEHMIKKNVSLHVRIKHVKLRVYWKDNYMEACNDADFDISKLSPLKLNEHTLLMCTVYLSFLGCQCKFKIIPK